MHSLEIKEQALDTAKRMIANGASLDEVATDTGIAKPTLRMWLTSLGDEYAEIRQTYIDNLLTTAIERIDGANDFLTLARAKQQWAYSTWIAERRDTRYSPVQQQASISINLVPPALQSSASLLLDSITTTHTQDESEDRVGDTNLSRDVVPPG